MVVPPVAHSCERLKDVPEVSFRFHECEAHFPFPRAVRPDVHHAAFLLLLGDSVDEKNGLPRRKELAQLDTRAESVHVQSFRHVAKRAVIRSTAIDANRNAETEPLAATLEVAALWHQVDRVTWAADAENSTQGQ